MSADLITLEMLDMMDTYWNCRIECRVILLRWSRNFTYRRQNARLKYICQKRPNQVDNIFRVINPILI